MKTKSLLLGSAAALFAVTGARAADAVIIPEPEAVEYVRVCDAYGTGYFYIPGSETCMRISGYVRVDIGFGGLRGSDYDDLDGSDNDTYNVRSRATVNIDTRRDTEYGTLGTDIELRAQYDTNGDSVGDGNPFYETAHEFEVIQALITLGGFAVGKTDSTFTTFTGYGGSVIADGDAGGYGPFGTNQMSYTFTSGAFTGVLALEQGAGDGHDIDGGDGWLIDSYLPHIVGGVSFDAGMFTIAGVAAYDTTADGWAGKVRVDAEITDAFSLFIMPMYAEGETSGGYGSWVTNSADTFSVIGGGSFDMNDKATLNAQVQWTEGNGGSDLWAVAANVNYTVTDGFIVRPEVSWLRDGNGDSDWGGMIRFQRSY